MSKEEKEKLVPNLRFKGFTDDWIQRQLSDILSVNSGRDYKHLNQGDIPVYGTGGYMTSVDEQLSSEDAIGLGRKGTINKPQLLKSPFWTVDTLFYLIPFEKYDLTFFYYLFQTINWLKYDESTGVPSLSKKTIEKIKVLIPSFEEQIAIGRKLKEIDTIITLEQEKREWLEEIKEYLITKLFSNSSRIPDLRFNNFIDRWDKYQLFELGDYYNGLSGKTKKDFGHGEAEYIVYKNVYSNPIADVSGIDKVEIDLKQNEVRYGDILFTTSSETPDEVGLTSVWMETKKNVYLNSFCFGFRPNRYINPYFIAYYLRSDYFRNQMIPLAQGISRYNISKIKVMDLEIILPDREEQDKIGNAFKLLDESLIANREKLKRLKKVKAMLLQDLFI